MSTNRENVTWQSEDGKWNIAFFDFYYVNEDSPDFDYEWDVEYRDTFNFVSMGHRTEEEAYQSYAKNNSNPGGTTVSAWNDGNADYNRALDAKGREFIEAQHRARAS